MGRHKELTDRDKEIIKDLYNIGVMKMNHIAKIYFNDSTISYARKRIRQLKNRGYIKREGHKYRATDKGVKACNIKLAQLTHKLYNKANMKYKLTQGDVYMHLHQYGWKWIGSREAKANNNLDRTCWINGQLVNTHTKEKYMVYILSKKPAQQTLGKIKHEISGVLRDSMLNKVIIFINSVTGYEHFNDENTYRANKLLVLPLGVGKNTILPCTTKSDWLEKLLPHVLDGVSDTEPCNELHADLYATINGERCYITELITHDMVKKYHLLKYGADQARGKVYLLTLNSMNTNLENHLEVFGENYPHVEVINIMDEKLKSLLDTPSPSATPPTRESNHLQQALGENNSHRNL